MRFIVTLERVIWGRFAEILCVRRVSVIGLWVCVVGMRVCVVFGGLIIGDFLFGVGVVRGLGYFVIAFRVGIIDGSQCINGLYDTILFLLTISTLSLTSHSQPPHSHISLSYSSASLSCPLLYTTLPLPHFSPQLPTSSITHISSSSSRFPSFIHSSSSFIHSSSSFILHKLYSYSLSISYILQHFLSFQLIKLSQLPISSSALLSPQLTLPS